MAVKEGLWTPNCDSKTVKFFRFLNLLDDENNVLSPTKFNTWAANLGGISALAATIFAWLGNHMNGIETLWAGSVGWMTQAHTARLFNNKEKNKTAIEMKKVGTE